ncbi:acyl carrier protein [Kitasatospora sp. NPDC052896]|uniref:acyl carrier protein n=1 Tax=Kitasatospora sp. NPDC052896 TaxID=3364061 RepID=UPI0037CC5979
MNDTHHQTYRLITGQLARHFRIAPGRLSPQTTFESLRIDSLALAELETALEDELDRPVRAPDGALRASLTLAEATAVLHEVLNPPAAGR